MPLWNYHIMAHLFSDVQCDVVSYAGHHWKHSADTHASLAVMLSDDIIEGRRDELSEVLLWEIQEIHCFASLLKKLTSDICMIFVYDISKINF